ncbi:MAG: putative lipoprotein [Myxococcales bacterium]|nr:putative lipoprotein [Myxococcales bacterium]
MKKVLFCLLIASGCGSDSPRYDPFAQKPECTGAAVVPYMGTNQQVISALEIGTVEDGFDLNGDGKPDNKLAAVGSLAKDAINTSFANYEIVIPLEFFDMPAVAADTCVKFAIYLAQYVKDADGDGKKPFIAKGDCNDTNKDIFPGATENPTNRIDDNCDGLADESAPNTPCATADCMVDHDGDGQTIAQGDCDDTNPMIHKGAVEICGDGLDNDCDGVADRTQDAMGNATACSPFDTAVPKDITLDPLSFSGSEPAISFKDGTVSSALVLDAGPSLFSVKIPVSSGIVLDLRITGATIKATLAADGTTTDGRLGGVIDAKTADTIRGLNVTQIGLTPENSLLDAIFANVLGPILALPKANATVLAKYPGCRTPDIDVDGDGLEAFCDSNDQDMIKTVDVCIDGDGTEIHDMVDGNGVTMHCTEALLPNGKPRFVDGISVELNFKTTRVKSLKPPQ